MTNPRRPLTFPNGEGVRTYCDCEYRNPYPTSSGKAWCRHTFVKYFFCENAIAYNECVFNYANPFQKEG